MAKNLFSYCAIDWYENELKKFGLDLKMYIENFNKELDIKNTRIDGIEQFIYATEPYHDMKKYADISIGVHLNYWPYWLDFYFGNERNERLFASNKDRLRYFGGADTVEEWLKAIRNNIRIALQNNPEYLVWHVSEANDEEIFTYKFNYDNKTVLKATGEIFNAVADEIPDDVAVLFENLWWPGLNLTSFAETAYFFSQIDMRKHSNIGIMLDTGHLMNTNPELQTEIEGVEYICQTVKNLGKYADLIKGVHLSCSLSGTYQKSFRRVKPDKLTKKQIWQHVTTLDEHKAFQTKAANVILACLKPKYIVHELSYDSLADLQGKLAQQLRSCQK